MIANFGVFDHERIVVACTKLSGALYAVEAGLGDAVYVKKMIGPHHVWVMSGYKHGHDWIDVIGGPLRVPFVEYVERVILEEDS